MANNIEEDIKILEDICETGTESYRNIDGKLEIVKPAYVKAIENVLNELKKYKKIVDGVKHLIEYDFNAWFEGNAEFPSDTTYMELVKYVKVEKLEKLCKED